MERAAFFFVPVLAFSTLLINLPVLLSLTEPFCLVLVSVMFYLTVHFLKLRYLYRILL